MSYRFPESAVFYRRLDRRYRCAVSARGSYITDEAGKRYLDASGGSMVANLGHGTPEIAEAVAAAAAGLGYVNGLQFTNRPAEELAAALTALLPEPPWHAYFLSSGSEAVEAAVKLARQYWLEAGHAEKWKVIRRVPSYHGNTLTALSLSGREHYRRTYAPLLTDFPAIPAPDPYRRPDAPGTTGEALEAEIERQGAETVAAFIAEPILGSAGGAVVPPPGYYRRIAEACRRHGVLFIADEVLTGMGRTGRWFAFQHFEGVPDILVLGKGLNAGVVPLSAVVARGEIVRTLAAGSGYFNHAQTYSHSPVTCAAGLATLRHLQRERLVERAAALGPKLLAALDSLRGFAAVGDVRGRGLLAAIEFVADRDTKEPKPRGERFAERFTETAFEQGLIVWPNVGHVDGERGDLVMIAPPLNAPEREFGEIAALCARTLEELG